MHAHHQGDTDQMVQMAIAGDAADWGAFLERSRARLRRMVALRLDARLRGRLDPSDVVQEAYLEATSRLPDYAANPTMPLSLWLRFLTGQKLVTLHRHHLGVHMRSARREVPLNPGGVPSASSEALTAAFLANDPRPSEAAARAELERRFQDTLEALEPMDREVLTLRHFEQLSNAETAEALGLQESAASKRYLRAIRRLKDLLQALPGWEEFAP